MIPKKIHYCWFGYSPLPESAQKCIESWRKYLPDYEIIEWNEGNFDVNSTPYTKQAYEAKKYAFVSDYARFEILYKYGGIYFDTDVEVIRPMDDIISQGPFMGIELKNMINPGLGIGATKGMEIYHEIIKMYRTLSFLHGDGSYNQTTIVTYVTDIFNRYGTTYIVDNYITIKGINIYPQDFFNPLNDVTGQLILTKNTRSIHWFNKTWLNIKPWRIRISRILHRVFGPFFFVKIRNIIERK